MYFFIQVKEETYNTIIEFKASQYEISKSPSARSVTADKGSKRTFGDLSKRHY